MHNTAQTIAQPLALEAAQIPEASISEATLPKSAPPLTPEQRFAAITEYIADNKQARDMVRYCTSIQRPTEIAFVGVGQIASTRLLWYSLAIGPRGLLIAEANAAHTRKESYHPVALADVERFDLDPQGIDRHIKAAHSRTTIWRWLELLGGTPKTEKPAQSK